MKLVLLSAVSLLSLFAQDTLKSPLQTPGDQAQGYVLQPGDVLDFKFFYNHELDQQAIIRPDGKITLQLVNEVQAAGLTAEDLTTDLKRLYDKDLARPELAMVVRSFSSQKAFVDGEVSKPGVIDLVNRMTVMQSIAQAGGMRDTARAGEVMLIRRTTGGPPKILRVDLSKIFSAKELSGDLELRPFDIVYVPKSRISKVNTWIDQYLRKNIPITFGFYTPIL
jgi:polysaccharide biosynthesis/export protein